MKATKLLVTRIEAGLILLAVLMLVLPDHQRLEVAGRSGNRRPGHLGSVVGWLAAIRRTVGTASLNTTLCAGRHAVMRSGAVDAR